MYYTATEVLYCVTLHSSKSLSKVKTATLDTVPRYELFHTAMANGALARHVAAQQQGGTSSRGARSPVM